MTDSARWAVRHGRETNLVCGFCAGCHPDEINRDAVITIERCRYVGNPHWRPAPPIYGPWSAPMELDTVEGDFWLAACADCLHAFGTVHALLVTTPPLHPRRPSR